MIYFRLVLNAIDPLIVIKHKLHFRWEVDFGDFLEALEAGLLDSLKDYLGILLR